MNERLFMKGDTYNIGVTLTQDACEKLVPCRWYVWDKAFLVFTTSETAFVLIKKFIDENTYYKEGMVVDLGENGNCSVLKPVTDVHISGKVKS